MGCASEDSFTKDDIDDNDFIMIDSLQIMAAGSEWAIMLGSLKTTTLDSLYVTELLEEVKKFITEAVAGSTAKGYSGHWKHWFSFAEEHGLVALPANPDCLCLLSTPLYYL